MAFVTQTIERNKVSQFAEEFFFVFISLQFIAAVLFTPALTAGAIAEEKQRKTLEYLLATDLGNHEIVLGKLVSRLGYLTLFLLTGLPMLSGGFYGHGLHHVQSGRHQHLFLRLFP